MRVESSKNAPPEKIIISPLTIVDGDLKQKTIERITTTAKTLDAVFRFSAYLKDKMNAGRKAGFISSDDTIADFETRLHQEHKAILYPNPIPDSQMDSLLGPGEEYRTCSNPEFELTFDRKIADYKCWMLRTHSPLPGYDISGFLRTITTGERNPLFTGIVCELEEYKMLHAELDRRGFDQADGEGRRMKYPAKNEGILLRDYNAGYDLEFIFTSDQESVTEVASILDTVAGISLSSPVQLVCNAEFFDRSSAAALRYASKMVKEFKEFSDVKIVLMPYGVKL